MTRVRICQIVLLSVAFIETGAALAQLRDGVPGNARRQRNSAMENRLRMYPLNERVMRGAMPSTQDIRNLAENYDVTRIVSILAEHEVPAGEQAAAREAGVTFESRPVLLGTATGKGDVRVSREAVRKLVDDLRDTRQGLTYLHCKSGKIRVGVVDFAYAVSVEKVGFADALRRIVDRGFAPGDYPGLVEDMKLLASGLDELPTVRGARIRPRVLHEAGALIPVGNVKLNVKSSGSGPAVYVLHGGPGETHKVFRPFLDPLIKEFSLVYYDQLGCGHSSRPQFEEAYALDRMVAELDGLREALQHEKISLIGHSSGGILATEYALTHRDRVDKLVIVSSWASAEELRPFGALVMESLDAGDLKAYRALQEKVRNEGRRLNDAEMADIVRLTYPLCFFGKMTPVFRADWNRRAQVSALVNYALAPVLLGEYDGRERLRELSGVPTLVISGEFDMITPPTVMKTIADSIGGARLEVFPRSGHYPFVEEQSRFLETVIRFLRTNK